MEKFDLIIIGGGPAGYLAAERAGDAGLKTLVVEKRNIGGVCLNEGCIPTKTFLYSSKIFETVKGEHGDVGIDYKEMDLNHANILTRKNLVVKTLVRGVTSALRKKKIRVIAAEASINREGNTFAVQCGVETYHANSMLIATGSEPVMPNIPGLSDGVVQGSVITSREALDMTGIPEKLAIVGAGVIGLEMAAYFSAAGSTVTIVEMLDKIAGELDIEAATLLQRNLEKKGISFHLSSKVYDISNQVMSFEHNGEKFQVPYDKLLMSVGRKPAIKIEGLDSTGVYVKNGAIVTNKMCMTNVPGIYAAGDVNGKYMLAHVAYREAEVAINNILGNRDEIDYSSIPGVIYTQPEIAFVGISQKQAADAGINTVVKTASANMSGRHIAEHGLSEGYCKLIIDQRKDIIIGAIIASAYASEIIYAVTLMIQNKIPLESIKRTIFPHPTVSEIIREAIFN